MSQPPNVDHSADPPSPGVDGIPDRKSSKPKREPGRKECAAALGLNPRTLGKFRARGCKVPYTDHAGMRKWCYEHGIDVLPDASIDPQSVTPEATARNPPPRLPDDYPERETGDADAMLPKPKSWSQEEARQRALKAKRDRMDQAVRQAITRRDYLHVETVCEVVAGCSSLIIAELIDLPAWLLRQYPELESDARQDVRKAVHTFIRELQERAAKHAREELASLLAGGSD